ncbi:MAG: hypothetical protein ACPGUC_09535 [Gammaproteobacteria bacterium]
MLGARAALLWSLIFLVTPYVHAARSPHWSCAGNDEAWSLSIGAGQARFERPMAGLGVARIELLPRADPPGPSGVGAWRGRAPGADADLVAFFVRTGSNVTATLSLPSGETLVGHCTHAVTDATTPSVPPVHVPWWERLPALAEHIQSCTARVSGEDVRVSVAWWSADGQVHLRGRNAYGGRWHCTTSADGHKVLAFAPLSTDSEAHPDEGIVIFTPRSNLQPPAGACYQLHRPIRGDAGALLGWLSDLVC